MTMGEYKETLTTEITQTFEALISLFFRLWDTLQPYMQVGFFIVLGIALIQIYQKSKKQKPKQL